MRTELSEAKSKLKADLVRETTAIRADVAEVKSDLKLICADMRQSEQRMVIKLGGLMVVAIGILLAALRYLTLPHS